LSGVRRSHTRPGPAILPAHGEGVAGRCWCGRRSGPSAGCRPAHRLHRAGRAGRGGVAVPLTRAVPTGGDWLRFGVLLAVGVAQAELSRRTERQRRFLASTVHVNMTSVWIFAGAVDLPQGLAVVLTVLIFGHLWNGSGGAWRAGRRIG